MRTILALCALVLLLGCSDKNSTDGSPLVVYASEDDPAGLQQLFAAFTSDTGVPLQPVWGNSSSNASALIARQGVPADVYVASNVADIVLAAYEGALRPMQTAVLDSVNGALKDPDGHWVSLQRRETVIAYSGTHDTPVVSDFEGLAEEAYLGRLCLSSITNSVNQSLIAWLMEDLGRRPAERVVRGWIRNLAAPPFATETELAAALESGACPIAILSGTSVSAGTRTSTPSVSYCDISAMGVGRHAQNPERAQQLIDWLIVNRTLLDDGGKDQRNVAIAGWGKEDALLLAERAGFN